MDPETRSLDNRVVFFPVRHHSPACARLVRRVIERVRPAAVLIEGPSDFNPQIEELFFPHQLPIAIYSYVHVEGALRSGAYYPFCVYSPEWQALQAARELGAAVRFIDLPWADMLRSEGGGEGGEELPSHRYADGELRYSDYIAALCRELHVDDFDTAWDLLFEIDPAPNDEELLSRLHHFCYHARTVDRHVPPSDLRREAFMAARIREAMDEFDGSLLVVTGGFHTSALYNALHGRSMEVGEYGGVEVEVHAPVPEDDDPKAPFPSGEPGTHAVGGGGEVVPSHSHAPTPPPPHTGISLTPYSYQRLDSLSGYNSGMPSPGFYHFVWESRTTGHHGIAYRELLARVVKDLRKRGQMFSAADLIAVETTARGLAMLRGHEEVWRRDLVDGIIGGLVKEELEYGVQHPFLAAVFEVLRGHERGRLADGTSLPPLVLEVRTLLKEYGLEPAMREERHHLELTEEADRERSRFLHRLRGLSIPGFNRGGGTDFTGRGDLSRLWETWSVRWAPEFEAGLIEAAIYGTSLEEATVARLLERAAAVERDAEEAARLLLDAAQMGVHRLAREFYARLTQLIREDSDFFSLTRALGHLLYLYQYDEAFGTTGDRDLGGLLTEAFTRGVWLLEGMGQAQGMEVQLLAGVKALVQTFERAGTPLELNGEEFADILHRVSADRTQSPLMQGAAAGALWTLGSADTERILEGMRYCADPARLGDFLAGLFALARETVQRHPELVTNIDAVIAAFDDEAFLEALPSMRLAFSYFTPREKHHMARTLLQALGIQEAEVALPELEVPAEVAAYVLAAETRLFRTVERYGLRPLRVHASEVPAEVTTDG